MTSNKGLTVAQSTLLRKTLREAGGEYKVAKHTLTKRALEGTPYAALSEFLSGARNLVFGYADPIGLTKVLLCCKAGATGAQSGRRCGVPWMAVVESPKPDRLMRWVMGDRARRRYAPGGEWPDRAALDALLAPAR